jgi:hypothetical protein
MIESDCCIMKKGIKRWIIIVIILTGYVLMPGCDKLQSFSGDSGFLEGIINIGPICPVQRDPPDPGCLPTAETFKAYPVSIWTADGKRKIKLISPALDGTYRTELAPGNYLVILERDKSKIGVSNLPLYVSISPEENTILDINIDTGIR